MTLNTIHNQDCIIGMQAIPDQSIDCILTDPPYKYLKNQKLEVDFDETAFFAQAKRVLKKDGFIVLFGRGTSFYRWNTMLADMGFTFKEEIVWDKVACTSPLMAMNRVHETVSIHTKGKGTINRVKVPYLEMKGHDIDSIIQDVKRLKTTFKNTKSLDAVLAYLENNVIDMVETHKTKHNTNAVGEYHNSDRPTCVLNAIVQGIDKKTIIRADMTEIPTIKYNSSTQGGYCDANRSVNVINAISQGMNEKSIIRTDWRNSETITKHNVNLANHPQSGDRSVDVINSVTCGMNEKTIIKQARDHYSAIHPTQKPARLLERLLALVTKEGDAVLDPFSGSGATAVACVNSSRKFIGYEIDAEYHQASIVRLTNHTQQMKLDIS